MYLCKCGPLVHMICKLEYHLLLVLLLMLWEIRTQTSIILLLLLLPTHLIFISRSCHTTTYPNAPSLRLCCKIILWFELICTILL